MKKNPKGLVVAGLSGGSGKSVVAVGLVARLRQLGHRVAVFKKGPDYIDAGWLGLAAGSPCLNLDPFLLSEEVIAASFQQGMVHGDTGLIEGNRGLYDGVNARGGFSTAELAIQLGLPVLLVVNCTKATRTVAAQVLGCRELDPRIVICGVVLNQVGTGRQEAVIREAVEQYTSIPVVGVVYRRKKDFFPMRHLGVTPHQETDGASSVFEDLAAVVAKNFDLETILAGMAEVPVFRAGERAVRMEPQVTIGILRDRAFQFYYEENLEALRRAGARLRMIDALIDAQLPGDLDGLYIGGGFPETSARAIAANTCFRESVRRAADAGLPIYAECGGLIFLGRSLIMEGEEFPLAGVFDVTFTISRKPQAHGYSIFRVEGENPFYPVNTVVKGHEFRYSVVKSWDGAPADLALAMERGTGFMDGRDGLVKKNVLALYTHVLAPGTPEWAKGLVGAARRFSAHRGNPDLAQRSLRKV